MRGLLKHENQDRLVPMASLHATPTASPVHEEPRFPRCWILPANQAAEGTSSSGRGNVFFSAVYDGHGGSSAATQAACRLHHHLQEEAGLRAALGAAGGC